MGRERVEFLISLIDCRALVQKFTPVTGDPGHLVFFLLAEIVSSTATNCVLAFGAICRSWFPVLLQSLVRSLFPSGHKRSLSITKQIASIILNRSTRVVDFN